jgi:hypothetical protein
MIDPAPHTLRVESRSPADRPIIGHDLSLFLDDKPLSRVVALDIRFASDAIVTATLTFELGALELPEGMVKLVANAIETCPRCHSPERTQRWSVRLTSGGDWHDCIDDWHDEPEEHAHD